MMIGDSNIGCSFNCFIGGVNMGKKYYYCLDTNKYVMSDDGVFYSIEKDGSLKINDYYLSIIFGDLSAEKISEEEFRKHL